MKLYVCWGTQNPGNMHACGRAYDALKDAGYSPDVVRCYGWKELPEFLNRTSGRRQVKELTGKIAVPVLVTDEGEVVSESQKIVEWAERNPAS